MTGYEIDTMRPLAEVVDWQPEPALRDGVMAVLEWHAREKRLVPPDAGAPAVRALMRYLSVTVPERVSVPPEDKQIAKAMSALINKLPIALSRWRGPNASMPPPSQYIAAFETLYEAALAARDLSRSGRGRPKKGMTAAPPELRAKAARCWPGAPAPGPEAIRRLMALVVPPDRMMTEDAIRKAL